MEQRKLVEKNQAFTVVEEPKQDMRQISQNTSLVQYNQRGEALLCTRHVYCFSCLAGYLPEFSLLLYQQKNQPKGMATQVQPLLMLFCVVFCPTVVCNITAFPLRQIQYQGIQSFFKLVIFSQTELISNVKWLKKENGYQLHFSFVSQRMKRMQKKVLPQ